MTASVAVVIVQYYGGTPFRRCLESCVAVDGISEVIVVDNGGLDQLSVRSDRMRVITMSKNDGFGSAANAGLSASRSDAVLVLNQDVEVSGAAVRALLRGGISRDAWIAGPKLVNCRGEPASPKVRFSRPLPWTCRGADEDNRRSVPWLSGAAMLFLPGHTDLRFDDRLFMYGEDEELCYRVWRDGGTVVMVDDAEILHLGGTATKTRWSPGSISRRTVLNRARFVRWHTGWIGVARYLGSLQSWLPRRQ